MAVTHAERVSSSMNLAARCINTSRVEIDYELLAKELKHAYDSNKDRPGLFASGDRGPINFKASFRDGILVLGGQTVSRCVKASVTRTTSIPLPSHQSSL